MNTVAVVELGSAFEYDVVMKPFVAGVCIKQITTCMNCVVVKDESEATGNVQDEGGVSCRVVEVDVGTAQSEGCDGRKRIDVYSSRVFCTRVQ